MRRPRFPAEKKLISGDNGLKSAVTTPSFVITLAENYGDYISDRMEIASDSFVHLLSSKSPDFSNGIIKEQVLDKF